MNKIIGIYGIEINKKWYIGSSADLISRLSHHKTLLRTGNHRTKSLMMAFEMYKIANIEILEIVEDIKTLESLESYYMGLYDSIYNGYNTFISKRGESYICHHKPCKNTIKLNEKIRTETIEYKM